MNMKVFNIGIVFFLLLLVSCATKTKIEYVDREVVKYETKVQHDTLVNNVHDSIFHTIMQKGDTIFDTKYVEKVKYRDKIQYKSDTLWRDSIQVQVKKEIVEKKIIPKWCYFCLFVCCLFAIFAIKKIILWVQIH